MTFAKCTSAKDHRGVDLVSDALPFGRLWYGKPNAIANAINSGQFPLGGSATSRSKMASALVYSLAACAISLALEVLFAGSRVKARFAELRVPRYAPPLWTWVVIGAFYYVICFAVLYRLLSMPGVVSLRRWAVMLFGSVMLINPLWNYFFFRTRNLFHAFVIGFPYSLIALVLFLPLLRLDRVAAFCLLPYLFYLIYANALGYCLWKLNPRERLRN